MADLRNPFYLVVSPKKEVLIRTGMYTKQSNFLDGSYANNNAYVRVVY